jgi:hypothetical protein
MLLDCRRENELRIGEGIEYFFLTYLYLLYLLLILLLLLLLFCMACRQAHIASLTTGNLGGAIQI